MPFTFDELKKNFKDVTDKTVKKTSELTNIAKLSVSIKTEEAKLSDCYKSIGRLFYTAERDNLDNTEEIATHIMQADKIKATIAEYQKELATLRKVVICEGCNNEISNDAIFCPICGLKVNKPAPAPEEEAADAECHCGCEDQECHCGCAEECECSGECDCECDGECGCAEETCECGCANASTEETDCGCTDEENQ